MAPRMYRRYLITGEPDPRRSACRCRRRPRTDLRIELSSPEPDSDSSGSRNANALSPSVERKLGINHNSHDETDSDSDALNLMGCSQAKRLRQGSSDSSVQRHSDSDNSNHSGLSQEQLTAEGTCDGELLLRQPQFDQHYFNGDRNVSEQSLLSSDYFTSRNCSPAVKPSSSSSEHEPSLHSGNSSSVSSAELDITELRQPVEMPNQENHQDIFVGNDRLPLLANALCPCTNTTEGDALLMCLALGIRHNLNWVVMVDIFKMINKLYGNEVVHESKYYLLKHAETNEFPTQFHLYCKSCECYLGTRSEIVDGGINMCECGKSLDRLELTTSYFLSIGRLIDLGPFVPNQKFIGKARDLQGNAYLSVQKGKDHRRFTG